MNISTLPNRTDASAASSDEMPPAARREQRARLIWLAGGEAEVASKERAALTAHRLAVGRKAVRGQGELGADLRRPSSPSSDRSHLEGLGHELVGGRGGGGEVTGVLLLGGRDPREPAVEVDPLGLREGSFDGISEEGMAEPDAALTGGAPA